MDVSLKAALNELQHHIDENSDQTLLIFESRWSLDRWKRRVQEEDDYIFKDAILVTLYDLTRNNGLTGRRFRNYCFMPL